MDIDGEKERQSPQGGLPTLGRPTGQKPASGQIAGLRFRSDAFPLNERFDRWRATVGNTFELSAPGQDGVGALQMDASVWNFGSLILGNNKFGSRMQRRTARNIRTDQVDHYRLLLQTAGSLSIDADGQRESLQPSRLVLFDMARPEIFCTDSGGSNIVLFIPRDVLDEALPRPRELHGVTLTGRSAALLSAHMESLVSDTALFTPQEVPALNDATVSLLAAALARTPQSLEKARPAMEVTLLRQACRYIEFHLSELELSAEQICKFFKVSRATLYRMFEPYGGVSHFIKERRLLRIHAVLASSTQRQNLSRLAEDYGFKTATHFSRGFREHFGYSPSEARQVSAGPSPSVTQAPSQGSFNHWMRSLRD